MAEQQRSSRRPPLLEDPVERLETPLAITMPSSSRSKPTLLSLAFDILQLSSYGANTSTTEKTLKKLPSAVAKELSSLYTRGFIKTVRPGNRQVHVPMRGG
jgi:hypothetical protein